MRQQMQAGFTNAALAVASFQLLHVIADLG
jgi:hypothetical protein